jgi:hypothetical protein
MMTSVTKGHPDTQAIFISVASFNAHRRNLTQFRGYPGRSLQWAASHLFPEHTTVIGQYYFRFERNNAMIWHDKIWYDIYFDQHNTHLQTSIYT